MATELRFCAVASQKAGGVTVDEASLMGFGGLQVCDFHALGLLLIVWDNACVETGGKLGVHHSLLTDTLGHVGLFV